MSIYFLDDGLYELSSIGLLHSLVEIHDVSHHLCMKRYRVTHSFLKAQVILVFSNVQDLGFFEFRQYCPISHVMHATIPIK